MRPTMIAAVFIMLCSVAHATDSFSFHKNEMVMNDMTGKMLSSEFSSQARQERQSPQRQRPRIRIQREQPAAWGYPRPGEYSWPGPGAVRQCVDWYATEYRPSGTVITPQMRCRWVRG